MEGYEAQKLLTSLSYQNWITKELFSFGWFVILGVVVVVYAVWLKLLDRTRVREILLFGSLCSVGFILADVILGSYFGFTSHSISLFPFTPDFFIVSITVTPVLFMLVYQYTSSWQNYTIWLIICTAILSFALAPLYMNLGILKYYNGWNNFVSFLRTFTDGMIGRAMIVWLASVEHRQQESSNNIQQGSSVLRPIAQKPFSDNEPDTDGTK